MSKVQRRRKDLKIKLFSKAIFIIIVITACFIFFKITLVLIRKLPYFRVNEVIITKDGQVTQSYIQELAALQGENIFQIDLLKLSQRLQQKHPEFYTVRVVRVFPDRLIIELQARKYVAQVNLDKYYLVDKEGFILPQGKNFPFNELAIINLSSTAHKEKITVGVRCELDEMKTGLALLEEFLTLSGLKCYKIISINISSLQDISFFLDNRLEIKVTADNLKKKISLLNRLLPKTTKEQVKYIDLRFEDPVIKPK